MRRSNDYIWSCRVDDNSEQAVSVDKRTLYGFHQLYRNDDRWRWFRTSH
jgi:hypothetical protein